jgi:multidrug efflux pump subunit AcrB
MSLKRLKISWKALMIDRIRSLSIENLSLLYIWIDLNHSDPQSVKNNIRNSIDRVNDLPPEVTNKPKIEEFKSSNLPLLEIGITGGASEKERRDVASALEDRINDLKGISSVKKAGYRKREIKITADLKKLREKRVSLLQIGEILRQRNLRISGGNFSTPGYLKKVVTYSEFEKIEDIEDLIIRSNYSGRQVLLKDVAKIKEGYKKHKVITRTNGKDSINLIVRTQSRADIIDLSDAIKEIIQSLKKGVPPGIEIKIVNNMSYYTKSLLNIVTNNALIGMGFVIICLVIFLSKRTALWTAIGIPLSLFGAIMFFPYLGISINIITLITMILVLGLLVDDAIVIAENITRHREMGKEKINAALDGVREMFWPVTTTIITSILAFIPMFFLSGILGRFIATIPLVVIAALICSLLECTCLLPSHIVSGATTKEAKTATWWLKVRDFYEKALTFFLAHKYITLLAFILFLASSLFLFHKKMKFILFPYNDVDLIYILAEMPEGTPLITTSKKMEAVEKIVSQISPEETDSYVTRIGHHDTDAYGATGGERENYALVALILKPASKRKKTSEMIMSDLTKALKSIKEKEGFFKLWTQKYNDGPPVGRPVTVSIVGKNKEIKEDVFNEMLAFVSKIPGIQNLETDNKAGQKELRVIPHYSKMARLGVNSETLAHNLRVAFQGTVPTTMVRGGENIDFRLMILKDNYKTEKKIIEDLQVMNRMGRLLDLSPFVKFRDTLGRNVIRHYNGKPSISIYADVDEKVTTSSQVNKKIQEQFKNKMGENPGLQIVFGGEEKATQESIGDFIVAFPFAILGIYFVLTILFGSFFQPFIILASVPFGLAGVVISFFAFDLPLSFLAVIGSLGLVGIIVNDGLIMVSHLNQISRGKELTFELVMEGSKDRLRAVVLTTVTTVAGMTPTIFGIGGYEPFVVPIVLAVAGGLIFATSITLILIPILYSFKIKKP